MRKLCFGLIALIIVATCLADEIQVPMACYPKKLQEKFTAKGYKLDLSANDRDEKSWGFIESRGAMYKIFTYKQVTPEELNDIQAIAMEE